MQKRQLSDHSREVAKGTFWGLVGTFFTKIISFVYTIYVAHVVSQGDLGLFYLSLAIVSTFGVIKDWGLPSALTRYIPYYESRGQFGKLRELVKKSYVINFASGMLFSIAVWLAAPWAGTAFNNAGLPEALQLMAAFMVLDNKIRLNTSYLQGRAEIKLGQAIGVAQLVAKLLFTVIFFELWGANILTLTASFLLSTLAGILISAPFIFQRTAQLPSSQDHLTKNELWKEIPAFGIILTLQQTFSTIVVSADKVILGYILGSMLAPSLVNEQVAIYSIATTLGVNIMVFPGAVGGIFLPIFSRLFGKGKKEEMVKAIANAQRWVLFITLPMAAVMVAFSSEMLSVFFGQIYAPGAGVMGIFVVGLALYSFAYIAALALAGMRMIRLELEIAVICGIVNVALNLLLIPSMGIEGAAISSAASYILTSMLFLHFAKKMIGFSSPASSYLLLLAGIITFGIILLCKPYVALAASMLPSFGASGLGPYGSKLAYLSILGASCVFSFIIFGALSLAFRCFGREDLLMAEGIASKFGVPNSFWEKVEPVLLRGLSRGKD